MRPDRLFESARLAAIVESSPDAIISNDLDGNIITWNRAAEQIFGYSAAEIVGMSIMRIIPPDRQQDEAHIMGRIKQGETVDHFETRRLSKEGRLVDISIVASPIKDSAGRVVGVSKIARDISERKRADEALDASHQRFQEMLETVKLIAMTLDRDGNVTFCNDFLLHLTGWQREEVVGREWFANFLPDPVAFVKAFYLDNIGRGTVPKHYQNPIKTRRGELRTIEWNNTMLRDVAGRVIGVASIGEDITERVQAADARQTSETRYRALFEYAPEGILIADSASTYLDANARICHMLGYDREELIGRHARDILAPGEIPHIEEMLNAIHAQTDRRREWKFRRKDGSIFDAEVSATVMPDGNILGIIRDVTERTRAEEVLRTVSRQETGRYKAGILRDLLVIFALGGISAVILETTDLAQSPFNRVTAKYRDHLDEVFGMLVVMVGGFLIFAYRRWKEAKNRLNQHTNVEEALRILHGELEKRVQQRTLELTQVSTALRAEIVQRQKEQEQREKLEVQFRQAQKMEGVGLLAGGVAHDFNNILAVIQMQSELLKASGNLSSRQSEFANEIGITVQRAAALTRQLLLFSRQEVFQPRDLELSDSLTQTAKMLHRILGENIEMDLKLAGTPMFIHADPGMMDQVLLNLAVNARDSMPNGGQLIIKTAAVEIDQLAAGQLPHASPGSYVCLSVSDTGCGIPAANLVRIFEPFFTTKDVGKGTGLGLATVFGIVQQHRGWINVYSEVGHGTTFRVYLPRLSRNPGPDAALTAPVTALGGNETILVVEDDSALRTSVRMALTQLGYHILEASNGPKALEIWKEHDGAIRLVLTDLVMPHGMTGKQLAQCLLQETPALPIIYMSGYSAEVIGKDYPLQEGVNFLTKPFKAQALGEAVRRRLDASKTKS